MMNMYLGYGHILVGNGSFLRLLFFRSRRFLTVIHMHLRHCQVSLSTW